MKQFNYKARDQEGQLHTGLIEAASEKQAARVLRERHLLITLLKLKKESFINELRAGVLGKISFTDKVNFTRQLATMINAGLNITKALRILQEQANPAMSKLVGEVLNQVESGNSLNKAMSAHPKVFDEVYIALVRAGEEAGVLDKILSRLAENLEADKEFKSKIKGAMIYPIIIVVGMLGVASIMLVFVIPKLTVLFDEFQADLPMSTKILIGLSDFLTKFWYLALLLIGGLVVGVPQALKNSTIHYQYDRLFFKVPIIGPLRLKSMMADFARTLSLLIGAGVLVVDALNIVKDSLGSPLYQEAVGATARQVQKGYPMAAALADTNIFPSILPQMIAVGEETGKTDEVLQKIADFFSQEAEQAVKNLTTAIEPLIMILLGLGVGFMVIAVIMPIYTLTSQF